MTSTSVIFTEHKCPSYLQMASTCLSVIFTEYKCPSYLQNTTHMLMFFTCCVDYNNIHYNHILVYSYVCYYSVTTAFLVMK